VHGLGEEVRFYPARITMVEGTELKRLIGVSLILNVQIHPFSPITAIPSQRQRPAMRHQKKQGKEANERANIEASQAGT